MSGFPRDSAIFDLVLRTHIEILPATYLVLLPLTSKHLERPGVAADVGKLLQGYVD